MGSSARHFYEAVRIGERIKQAIKMEKLEVLLWIPEQLQDMNQNMALKWETLVMWSSQVLL